MKVFWMGFLLLLLFFWTAWVLYAGVGASRRLFQQHRARKFPMTTGRIIRNEVKPILSSKGMRTHISYRIEFEYEYRINGKDFRSTRYRYGVDYFYDPVWRDAVLSVHPIGSEVPVFYNPTLPEDSLIAPGIKGSDLVSLLPPCGFTAISLLVWRYFLHWFKIELFKPPAGGVKIISQGGQTRVRLPGSSPIMVGFTALALLSFFSSILTEMTLGLEPSVRDVCYVWSVVIGISLAFFFWRLLRVISGKEDLVIDEAMGTVILPRTFGRKRTVRVNIAEIASLDLCEVYGRNYYCCYPTLHFHGQEPANARLAAWPDRGAGEAFTAWLCEQLHLPFQPPNHPEVR